MGIQIFDNLDVLLALATRILDTQKIWEYIYCIPAAARYEVHECTTTNKRLE